MSIKQRVAKLERQNRRLKGGLGLIFALALGAGLVGWGGPKKIASIVKSKAYHLVADDGSTIVTMSDLNKRLSALEAKAAATPKTPEGANPAIEAEAQKMADAIQKAIGDLEGDQAKTMAVEFEQKYSGTKAHRRLKRTLAEVKVVGIDAGKLDVSHWYQGVTSMDEGKVSMLVFWEVWCPHCKREIPKIESIYNRYRERGLNVVGLTKASRSSTDESISAFIRGQKVTYPMAKEQDGGLSARFSVRGVPAAALVKDGKVIWRGHPARISDALLDKALGL